MSWFRSLFILAILSTSLGHAESTRSWTPEDLESATKLSLSEFRNFYYGDEPWNRIQSYTTVRTKLGAVVRVSFLDEIEHLETTDFICRYVDFEGAPRMDCREH